MGIWYCTREDVSRSLDAAQIARTNAQIDREIEASSRSVEDLTHRLFYPTITTRYFDWPTRETGHAWELWLNQYEAIAVTALTSGGVNIPTTDFYLEPVNEGPPFSRICIDLTKSSTFGGGLTYQKNIVATGTWGYGQDTAAAGTVATTFNASILTMKISDSSLIGVGQLLLIGTERIMVTQKTMVVTGDVTGNSLTSNNSDQTIGVPNGTLYNTDEIILLDAERMLITDIVGNNLIVKRAWDGTTIATHSISATVYALRQCTITRGLLGTTAASHTAADPILKHMPPGPIRNLTIAESMTALEQEKSAYARTIGSGDNMREASGKGLRDIREQIYSQYGRKSRTRVV